MKEVELKLNEKEAQALVDLIDVATKTKGLDVAETAVYLFKKIQTAFNTKEVSKDVE